jgi:hypothetical protein
VTTCISEPLPLCWFVRQIFRVLYTKDPLNPGDKQPNMLSTLRTTALRLPIRTLRSAQGAWALNRCTETISKRGTLSVGLYTNTLLGSAKRLTRNYVAGCILEHTASEGFSTDILSLWQDRQKINGSAPSLLPPTSPEMFKALVESGQATAEDAVYFLASMRAKLHHRSLHERRAAGARARC